MHPERLGTALSVIASAVRRELVVDNPSSVVIYGRTLEPAEIRWLFFGMTAPMITELPYAGGRRGVVEDTQIVGMVLGREYRLVLRADAFEALLADLRIEVARRAAAVERAHARAVVRAVAGTGAS